MHKLEKPAKAVDSTSRPRGRPRAFDRDAALDQATRRFWIRGFDATSIAELTDAMGIRAPSLYAAFGSKEALYAEALRHYGETNEHFVWSGFFSAATAREAVRSLLMDSAAALTGCLADIPRGCMVTLSTVGSDGHEELRELARSARAVSLERLEARLTQAIAEGELAEATDIHALARFVQTVQTGMSIPARDGATRDEMESVAELAMLAWDARTGAANADPPASAS